MGAVRKIVGAVTGSNAAEKAAKAQEEAMRRQAEQMRLQQQKAEEAMRLANAKMPDIDAIKIGNSANIGTTLLTGSEGLSLGEDLKKKKTLLGI